MKFTNHFFSLRFLRAGTICAFAWSSMQASAQTEVSLNDLSSFKNPGKSWLIAGDASADLTTNNKLTTATGTGILVNLPSTA